MIYELKQPAFDALINRFFQAYFDDSDAFAPLGAPASFHV